MQKLIFEAKLRVRLQIAGVRKSSLEALRHHDTDVFRKYFVVRETHDANTFDSGVARDSTPYSFRGGDHEKTHFWVKFHRFALNC